MAKFNTAERAAITRDEFIERLRAWAPGKLKVMAAQAERDRRIAEATKAATKNFSSRPARSKRPLTPRKPRWKR